MEEGGGEWGGEMGVWEWWGCVRVCVCVGGGVRVGGGLDPVAITPDGPRQKF